VLPRPFRGERVTRRFTNPALRKFIRVVPRIVPECELDRVMILLMIIISSAPSAAHGGIAASCVAVASAIP